MNTARTLAIGCAALLALSLACGGSAPVPAPQLTPKNAVPNPKVAACFPAQESWDALTSVASDARTLRFCTDACCYDLQIDRVELSEDCKAPPANEAREVDFSAPRMSPNGARQLVVIGPLEPGGVGPATAVVSDIGTGEEIGRFALNNLANYECGDARFLTNDRILVLEDVCAGPAGVGWLATPEGKRIAPVGGRDDFGAFAVERVHAAGDVWAFLEEGGRELVYQNVQSGAVVHTVDLRAGLPDAVRTEESDPAITQLLKTEKGEIVVAYGGSGQGVFTVMEPTVLDYTGALTSGRKGMVLVAPRCAR
ncbi:MAG: hypothetical protein ACI9MR_003967 [Myxococcota bacterium]|jgi:hypothetical protein